MNKALPPLCKHEWDFRPCTDDEAPACWTYEFLREQSAGKPSIWKDMLGAFADPFYQMASLMDQFPKAPWLSIPKQDRLAALAGITRVVAHAAGIRQSAILVGSKKIDTHISTISLDLDWRKSDTMLKREFETKLLHLRGLKIPSENAGGRKGSPRDNLKALAARRLLRHFGNDAERAIQHMDRQSGTSLYNDAGALRRAAKKADGLISGKARAET
jgi:hypothetical protein